MIEIIDNSPVWYLHCVEQVEWCLHTLNNPFGGSDQGYEIRWLYLGSGKFNFEYSEDALMFKLKFRI
jgi:hypothetical protein